MNHLKRNSTHRAHCKKRDGITIQSPARRAEGSHHSSGWGEGGTCCMGLRQRLLREPSSEPENRTSSAQCTQHTCWVYRGSLTRAHKCVPVLEAERVLSCEPLYLFCIFWRPDSYFSLQAFTLVWLQWSYSWFMLLKLLMQKGDKAFNLWWEVPWFHTQFIYIRVEKKKGRFNY